MHVKLLVLLIFYIGAVSSAHAAIQADRCDACSEAQYETTAMNIASANGQGRGYVFIYDLINHNFRKFSIAREPRSGGWQYFVTLEGQTAQETTAWTVEEHALTANGGRSNFFRHVDSRTTNLNVPHRNETSFNIMLTSAYQNDLSDWLLHGGS